MGVLNSKLGKGQQSLVLIRPPFVNDRPSDGAGNTKSPRISKVGTSGGYTGKNIGA